MDAPKNCLRSSIHFIRKVAGKKQPVEQRDDNNYSYVKKSSLLPLKNAKIFFSKTDNFPTFTPQSGYDGSLPIGYPPFTFYPTYKMESWLCMYEFPCCLKLN